MRSEVSMSNLMLAHPWGLIIGTFMVQWVTIRVMVAKSGSPLPMRYGMPPAIVSGGGMILYGIAIETLCGKALIAAGVASINIAPVSVLVGCAVSIVIVLVLVFVEMLIHYRLHNCPML
ncbi:MAG: hypothetical protein WC269_01590 [Candidatus Gracilibacteria bacterium]